jgi:hypothetical protein
VSNSNFNKEIFCPLSMSVLMVSKRDFSNLLALAKGMPDPKHQYIDHTKIFYIPLVNYLLFLKSEEMLDTIDSKMLIKYLKMFSGFR